MTRRSAGAIVGRESSLSKDLRRHFRPFRQANGRESQAGRKVMKIGRKETKVWRKKMKLQHKEMKIRRKEMKVLFLP